MDDIRRLKAPGPQAVPATTAACARRPRGAGPRCATIEQAAAVLAPGARHRYLPDVPALGRTTFAASDARRATAPIRRAPAARDAGARPTGTRCIWIAADSADLRHAIESAAVCRGRSRSRPADPAARGRSVTCSARSRPCRRRRRRAATHRQARDRAAGCSDRRHATARAVVCRVNVGELGAEDEDLRRVVDPDDHHDQRAGCAIGRSKLARPRYRPISVFADREQQRGNRERADPDVALQACAPSARTLQSSTERAGGHRERHQEIDRGGVILPAAAAIVRSTCPRPPAPH